MISSGESMHTPLFNGARVDGRREERTIVVAGS